MTVKVTCILPSGQSVEICARPGETLMEVLRAQSIPGVAAECGGACACGTCHIYVTKEWLAHVNVPEEIERGMLECVAGQQPNSRLSCQIELTDALDGLLVFIPEAHE